MNRKFEFIGGEIGYAEKNSPNGIIKMIFSVNNKSKYKIIPVSRVINKETMIEIPVFNNSLVLESSMVNTKRIASIDEIDIFYIKSLSFKNRTSIVDKIINQLDKIQYP